MRAFEDLYARHRDSVFRFVWRRVGRRSIAEEITSETFLALFEHMDTIDVSLMPGWLFTVARHRVTDYWRRLTLEQEYLGGLPAEPHTPAGGTIDLGLLRGGPLKPVHRLCLELRYGSGMTLPEIAAHTGLTETQVKGYLQYARELLRRELLKTTE